MAGTKKPKSQAATVSRAPKADAEPLPSPQEAHASFALACGDDLARPRSSLLRLRQQPPQLIHLEGGEAKQRMALGLWWAAALNCEQPAEDGAPCLACPVCLRIGASMFADVICLDGENASIKIDDVRALRPLLGEPPRFGNKRVLLFAEAQALGVEGANSLLKVLEEPNPDTCFVFTAPQRERLLPTLVSRGWVITLPWPSPERPLTDEVREWAMALAQCAKTGTGWFARTSAKGAVNALLAQEVVLAGQKALADRLAGRTLSALGQALESVPDEQVPALDELFSRCQEALQAQVNPALTLDFLASHVHLLAHGQRGF